MPSNNTNITTSKKYKTKSGLDVIIYAIHPSGQYPVHGAIATDGAWISESWTSEGTYLTSSKPCDEDLVEIQ